MFLKNVFLLNEKNINDMLFFSTSHSPNFILSSMFSVLLQCAFKFIKKKKKNFFICDGFQKRFVFPDDAIYATMKKILESSSHERTYSVFISAYRKRVWLLQKFNQRMKMILFLSYIFLTF
jgi:hypothetical protein